MRSLYSVHCESKYSFNYVKSLLFFYKHNKSVRL